MTTPLDELSSLSSTDLDSRLKQMVARERESLVDFLWHLAEVQRRHLDTALGYESAFAYCNQHLHMSKASSFRRTAASRLVARFPIAADSLSDGRLCLTTLVELRDVLTHDNCVELLRLASGRTEDEVKLLVATLRPTADVTHSLRKVPVRPVEVPALPSLPAARSAAVASEVSQSPVETQVPVALVLPPPKPPSLEPLNAERYALRMSVGPDFKQRLEEVKSALSHVVPDGNLEHVMMECMRLALEVCARRRRGVRAAPAAGTSSGPEPKAGSKAQSAAPSRYVPVEVRQQVWTRDSGRCAFVGAGGRRCNSRYQLEVHHREPFAHGGEATVANLMLTCRRHNAHCARLDFGEETMARFERTG